MSRSTRAIVSLQNLAHNIRVIRSGLNPDTKYLAVVKADAYGHGCVPVSRCALANGASMLGVAFCDEALVLRHAGVDAPILLLGASEAENFDAIIENDLMPAVFDLDTLRGLQERAARLHKTCRVHLKADTGMHRIGFPTLCSFNEALELLPDCPNVAFSGLFTHFATSERADQSFTLLQAERFSAFADAAHAHGYRPLLHASNSAAALHLPALQLDMVRGGIAMYGCHPTGHDVPGVDLRPVMRLCTRVVMVKDLAAGESVSYGLTFTADRPMRIATLPVGYGDGYRRALSNKASVLLHGRRVRQIGTICMDQMMVDVTELPDAAIGDEAVLIGAQGGECITADELAALSGTISYEILLGIDQRVPRVYTE